jgi:hypothetical protein
MVTPNPEQIAAMIDTLRTIPPTLVADLDAMIDAERRCGSAIPDGWGTGRTGGGGTGGVGRPVETAVVARQAATDQHTQLTRRALDELRLTAAKVDLVAWHVDRRPPADGGSLAALVARIVSVPRNVPGGSDRPDLTVSALSQACGHLSVAVGCIRAARALGGPRRDPERCESPGCDGSAARDAGGRGGRCRPCVDWHAHHGAWPTARVVDALRIGDRVRLARLARDIADTR